MIKRNIELATRATWNAGLDISQAAKRLIRDDYFTSHDDASKFVATRFGVYDKHLDGSCFHVQALNNLTMFNDATGMKPMIIEPSDDPEYLAWKGEIGCGKMLLNMVKGF